jgi:hypothetical protein
VKSFSLTIRADDGATLLETYVEYMHQAFQRLIDWSIEAPVTGQQPTVLEQLRRICKSHYLKCVTLEV